MPTTQTIAPPPPYGSDKQIDPTSPLGNYIQTLQQLHPLREVDTSGGNYNENVPPPGNNSTTGMSNQNQEIIYIKKSADGNTFTLNAGPNFPQGPKTLVAQYDKLRIKSNGSLWYVVG